MRNLLSVFSLNREKINYPFHINEDFTKNLFFKCLYSSFDPEFFVCLSKLSLICTKYIFSSGKIKRLSNFGLNENLIRSVEFERVDVTKYLLYSGYRLSNLGEEKRKIDIHYKEDLTFRKAVKMEKVGLVKFLLENGANPYSRDKEAIIYVYNKSKNKNLKKLFEEKGLKYEPYHTNYIYGGILDDFFVK